MGQQLRMTWENRDYNFQLLDGQPVTRETREIRILLNGIAHDLVKQNGHWLPKGNDEQLAIDLAAAIGKTIELRFRV